MYYIESYKPNGERLAFSGVVYATKEKALATIEYLKADPELYGYCHEVVECFVVGR